MIDILYDTKDPAGAPANGHELYELMIDCNAKAVSKPNAQFRPRNVAWKRSANYFQVSFGPQEYGVRALSLVRATIARVRVAYAQSVGIVLNNGWINRQAQCSFSRPRKVGGSGLRTERCGHHRIEGCNLQHCGIGIKAFGEVNSVDILNTIIEHGSLAGIVVFSGMNMNIQGNCIEGIEGPAIVSSNMDSLTISNNYFESNNAGNASCHECVGPNGNKGQVSGEHDRLQASFLADGRCVAGPLVLKPVLFGATDKLPADAPGEITNFCDIVLTGALAAGTACMYVVSPTQKKSRPRRSLGSARELSVLGHSTIRSSRTRTASQRTVCICRQPACTFRETVSVLLPPAFSARF